MPKSYSEIMAGLTVTPIEDLTNIELKMEELETKIKSEISGINNKNVGPFKDQGMSFRSIGLIILGLGITFSFLTTGMCTMWCKRTYKKYYFEEQNRLRELEQEKEEKEAIEEGNIYFGNFC